MCQVLLYRITSTAVSRKLTRLFQLTRSRGAWRCTGTLRNSACRFQLTRSRGAWPTKTAMAAFRIAFQLTRSRGAWLVDSFDEIVIFDFNSHAHVERDSVMYIRPRAKAISTHTLTWSVTPWCRHPAGGYQFQLTRSRGAWRHTLNNIWTAQIFQLTRSRGAWRLHWIFFPYHNNFNSHAHVERDRLKDLREDNENISTHTLTWSVTSATLQFAW